MRIPKVHTSDRLINQLQQNITGALEPKFRGLTGTFQCYLAGFTSAPTGTAKWQVAVKGGPVSLSLPTLTGTSSATSMTLSGLPSDLWPKSVQAVLYPTEDNGTVGTGLCVIQPTGSVTFYKNAAQGSFTSSGTKGIVGCTVTYLTGV